ncbi:P-type DNA transfer ATPase VirB11 [Novosphingobium sp.]|uniref:P-type DNA transfer ATPase VirB11 n=1 Tax=Novosphingobium sp. TaxID=1874826 RepID=UPI003D0ED5AE
MSPTASNLWLETCLAPLAEHLDRTDVTDIWINRPGELWLELLGDRIERHTAPDLTAPLLLRMARQVAAVTAQGINREHPILSGSLPGGERIQVIIPPATRGNVAIAIRKHVMAGMSLEDYETTGGFAKTKVAAGSAEVIVASKVDPNANPMRLLQEAVRGRRNILISGGTASGKTTFLNALLREVPVHERLILIEDTPELQIAHENAVGLLSARSPLGEAPVTAEDLLIASLRMRPDRIILGEIRGAEAATFLRAVNTGHPGSITTIHADSPERAIDQLALLVLQTGIRMAWEDVVLYVARSLDIILQLKRGPDGRHISSIAVMR